MTEHEKRIREALEDSVLSSLVDANDLRALLADLDAMRGALEETLLFCETFSNRWDGQTGAHPFEMVERARAALQSQPAAFAPTVHIKEPYTQAELNARIASNDYNAELLLHHAMLLLNAQPAAPLRLDQIDLEPLKAELSDPAKAKAFLQKHGFLNASGELAEQYGGKPEQPAAAGVSDEIVAGVLFDFMGWLTSRDQKLTLSSTDLASPAVDALQEFAKMRGLNLDGANAAPWESAQTSPITKQLTPFEREQRYLVLKIADLKRYLPETQVEGLHALANLVDAHRIGSGKPPLDCVVVEADWPEFEPTWGAIEARLSGAILALRPQAVPMTDEQIVALVLEANAAPVETPTQAMTWIVRAIEAHHGITAQGAQGGEA